MYRFVLVGSARLSIFALNDASWPKESSFEPKFDPASELRPCSFHIVAGEEDAATAPWAYVVPGILWICYTPNEPVHK